MAAKVAAAVATEANFLACSAKAAEQGATTEAEAPVAERTAVGARATAVMAVGTEETGTVSEVLVVGAAAKAVASLAAAGAAAGREPRVAVEVREARVAMGWQSHSSRYSRSPAR